MIGSYGGWPVGPLGGWPVGPLGETNWDQISAGFSALAPQVVGLVSDLATKRKESLSGLLAQKSKIEKKLTKAKTSWDRDRYSQELSLINSQISALQSAITSESPTTALDLQLEKNKPGASPVIFIVGGIAVLGIGGLIVWSLTRKKGK